MCSDLEVCVRVSSIGLGEESFVEGGWLTPEN